MREKSATSWGGKALIISELQDGGLKSSIAVENNLIIRSNALIDSHIIKQRDR